MARYVDDFVDAAIKNQDLGPMDVKLLTGDERKSVLFQAREKFVDGNPRVWWLSLKGKSIAVPLHQVDAFSLIRYFWPQDEPTAYFVPENDSIDQRVFEATAEAVISILGDSPYFEYNIVGKAFDWLLIENDHDLLIYIGEKTYGAFVAE
jgi:hypothetical protein